MRTYEIVLALTAFPAVALCADRIQMIAGAAAVSPRPDGSLYLSGRGHIEPTPGAYRSEPQTGKNYLRRYDPAKGAFVFATYLNFFLRDFYVDDADNVYLLGQTHDDSFAITPGAYNRGFSGGEQIVVAKLHASGAAMEFVTVLGGSGRSYDARAGGIAVDKHGRIYVSGKTCSNDFPTTPDALQPSKPGTHACAAFLSMLNPTGSKLLHSTYLGGSSDTSAPALWLGDDGRIHLLGETDATDLPTTPESFTTPIPDDVHYPVRTFLARWDPETRRFESIAAFGSFLNPLLIEHRKGRIVLYAAGFAKGVECHGVVLGVQ